MRTQMLSELRKICETKCSFVTSNFSVMRGRKKYRYDIILNLGICGEESKRENREKILHQLVRRRVVQQSTPLALASPECSAISVASILEPQPREKSSDFWPQFWPVTGASPSSK